MEYNRKTGTSGNVLSTAKESWSHFGWTIDTLPGPANPLSHYIKPHCLRFSCMMMSGSVLAVIRMERMAGDAKHTINCCHDESNLCGIRGTGEVRVNLLRLRLV